MKTLLPILAIILLISSCSPKIGTKAENLTGDKIVENFIKAIGGEKNLKAVKTMTMIAVANIEGIELQIESYRKAPDKMLVKMISPQGTMTRVLNGETAFAHTPYGNQPITGIDLQALQEEATIFPELYHEQFGFKLDYLGIEKVNERDMYKVKISMPSGDSRFQFYDKETNLLNKMIDELGTESFYDNYKEIEGIKIPHSNKLVTPQGSLNFQIQSIEINPAFEDEMFGTE